MMFLYFYSMLIICVILDVMYIINYIYKDFNIIDVMVIVLILFFYRSELEVVLLYN